jgi:hypothetical protein
MRSSGLLLAGIALTAFIATVATHDPSLADLADTVIRLEDGRLADS